MTESNKDLRKQLGKPSNPMDMNYDALLKARSKKRARKRTTAAKNRTLVITLLNCAD